MNADRNGKMARLGGPFSFQPYFKCHGDSSHFPEMCLNDGCMSDNTKLNGGESAVKSRRSAIDDSQRPGTAACVAQVFQPAGSRDFPVPCSYRPCHRPPAIPHHVSARGAHRTTHGEASNTGLESPVYPPTRKSALRLPHQQPNESC